MIILCGALLTLWLFPGVKVLGEIALWHIWLGLLIVLISIIPDYRQSLIRLVRRNGDILIAMSVFPVLIMVRDWFGGSIEDTLQAYLLRGVAGFLLALAIGIHMRRAKSRAAVLLALGVITAIQATVALLQLVAPERFFDLPMEFSTIDTADESQEYSGRVRGLFMYNHMFGQQLLGPTVLLLAFVAWGGRWPNYGKGAVALQVIVAVLAILAIFATYLRSAYWSLLLAIAILALWNWRRTRLSTSEAQIRTLSVLMLSLIGAVAFGMFQTPEAGRLVMSFGNVADEQRLASLVAGVAAFLDMPLIGVGGRQVDFDIAIHNVPLRVLAYYGVLGLLGYIVFYTAVFKGVARVPSVFQPFKQGLMLWLITYILFGLAHTGGFWLGGIHEWTFIGIMLGLQSDSVMVHAGKEAPAMLNNRVAH
jgi:hypothetical protein